MFPAACLSRVAVAFCEE